MPELSIAPTDARYANGAASEEVGEAGVSSVDGHEMVGGRESMTETQNWQPAVMPAWLVATHATETLLPTLVLNPTSGKHDVERMPSESNASIE